MSNRSINRPGASDWATVRTVFVARAGARCGRGGFTLVELVMVLLVIGIVAAIAVPRYGDAIARYRVDAASRRIAADLTLAASRAKATSTSQTVAFKVSQHFYVLTGMPDPVNAAQYYTVDLLREPYKVRFQSVEVGGGDDLVNNGFGIPDTGAKIVVGVGGYQKAVIVDASTGAARIE